MGFEAQDNAQTRTKLGNENDNTQYTRLRSRYAHLRIGSGPASRKAPQRGGGRTGRRAGPGKRGRPPEGGLTALPGRKRPARARRPGLPQPGAAVLSAMAGLTAGFGMGPGDPRLRGRARAGRSLRSSGAPPCGAGVLGPACAHDVQRVRPSLIDGVKSSGC